MKWIIGIAVVIALAVMGIAIYMNIGSIVQQLLASGAAFFLSVIVPALFKRRSPEDEAADHRLVAEGESTDRFKAHGHGGENR